MKRREVLWTARGANFVEIAMKTIVRLHDSKSQPTPARQNLVVTHGTGLTKECMEPLMLAFLRKRPTFVGSISLMDTRFHGASQSGLKDEHNHWIFAADLMLAIVEIERRFGPGELIGIGHSAGASLWLMAAFQGLSIGRLFLFEPIVFMPPYRVDFEFFMAKNAMKRKTEYASKEAAYESLKTTNGLKLWDDQALRNYVEHGFIEATSGKSGVQLRMPAEIEASIFANCHNMGLYDLLRPLPNIAIYITGGPNSQYCQFIMPFVCEKLEVPMQLMARGGHTSPMEFPEEAAERLGAFLDEPKPLLRSRL